MRNEIPVSDVDCQCNVEVERRSLWFDHFFVIESAFNSSMSVSVSLWGKSDRGEKESN